MSTRKEFILASSLAAAVAPSLALANTAAKSPTPPAAQGHLPPFVFDRAAFDAIIVRPVKHRHAFASVEIDNGVIFSAMTNVLNAYEMSLGEKPASVTSAAVLYHGLAISMGFNDTVWNELFIPAAVKDPRFKGAVPKAGSGNPWLHRKAAGPRDASIEALTPRGAAYFVCNNAASATAYDIATALGRTPVDVYNTMAANLVPQAMLVPAGVWAIHALQEAHFTYEQVSL